MTLLITVFSAITSTIVWYTKDIQNKMKVGTLSLIYWGASLMWFVDAVFEYIELGETYFTPPIQTIVNDAFLGCCVTALGLILWLFLYIIYHF